MGMSASDLKNPKALGGILLLVVAAVVLFVGVLRWLEASAERRMLADRLSSTRRTVAQLMGVREAEPEQLRQEIEQVRGELVQRLQAFPRSEEARAEIATYYTLAARYDAQVARIEAQPVPTPDPPPAIREDSYLVEVRGPARNLLRLLGAITDSPFETIVYRDLSLGQDRPAWAELRVTVLWCDLDYATLTAPAAGGESP